MNINRTKPALAWLLCALLAVSLALPALAADDDTSPIPSNTTELRKKMPQDLPNTIHKVQGVNKNGPLSTIYIISPSLTPDSPDQVVSVTDALSSLPFQLAVDQNGRIILIDEENEENEENAGTAGEPSSVIESSGTEHIGNTITFIVSAFEHELPDIINRIPRNSSKALTPTLTLSGDDIVILDSISLHRLTAEGDAQIITAGDTDIRKITLGGKSTLTNAGHLTIENLFLLQKSAIANQGSVDVQRVMQDDTATITGHLGTGPDPVTPIKRFHVDAENYKAIAESYFDNTDPGANPYGPVIDDGDDTSSAAPACTCSGLGTNPCFTTPCGGAGCTCVGVSPLP